MFCKQQKTKIISKELKHDKNKSTYTMYDGK